MSNPRPKRRATINKNYNEVIDEPAFESRPGNGSKDAVNGNMSLKNKKGSSPASASSTNQKKKSDNDVPYNWQPDPELIDHFSYKLDLEDAYIDLSTQTLYCPNQTSIPSSYQLVRRRKLKESFKLTKGDYIYMISEPPGEPYYIGRIMGYKPKNNSFDYKASNGDSLNKEESSERRQLTRTNLLLQENIVSPKDYSFFIQWFYRPRDILRSTSDSRLLYASMHSDTCPIQSFRGTVTVKHKLDIEYEYSKKVSGKNEENSPSPGLSPLELYSQNPNCFYFDKLFDRYMVKFYDVILTSSLLRTASKNESNSKHYLKALHKRFEFIFVEKTVSKSFVNGFLPGSCCCEVCGQWCSSQESVTCGVCNTYFHMNCLDPPLLKKPSRGFSWSCAQCTKKYEIEHQSKKMVMLSHDNKSSNESQIFQELNTLYSNHELNSEDDDSTPFKPPTKALPRYESMAIDFLNKDRNLTLEQRRLKEEWTMRYLGMHARLEDGVDLDDRSPYPRASTRLGSKHQCTNIPECNGHPIVYYDTDKKSLSNGKRKESQKKLSVSKKQDPLEKVKLPLPKEFENTPPHEFPEWLQERPRGYIERGVDDGEGVTCTLLWKPHEEDIQENFKTLDSYMDKCASVAKKLNILPTSPNFVDAILKLYLRHNRNTEEAYKEVAKLTRKALSEPTFSKEEIKKFENGIKKYGSDLYPVSKEVKSQPTSMIVRFYYLWKKTKNGRLIWGNYEGRKQKKVQNMVNEEQNQKKQVNNTVNQIDMLADSDDDSSYENEKIIQNRKKFCCKHCRTTTSNQWYRITGFDANTKVQKEVNEDFDPNSVIGLCFRCARLWRRYGVIWEEPSEVEKKKNKYMSTWKKRIEYELLRDSRLIYEEAERRGSEITHDFSKPADAVVETNSVQKLKKATNNKISLPKTPKAEDGNKSSSKAAQKSQRKPSTMASKMSSETKPKISNVVSSESKKVSKKKERETKIKTEVRVQSARKKTLQPKIVKTEHNSKSVSKPEEKQENDEAIGTKQDKRKRKKTTLIDSTTSLKDDETFKPEPGASLLETSDDRKVKPPAAKRHKKAIEPSKDLRIINPVLNRNYASNGLTPIVKTDKKSVFSITKESLAEILIHFREKQLMDFRSQCQIAQIPASSTIVLPFDLYSRPCCICKEECLDDASSNEMLMCCNCGVNVHASCSGISIPQFINRPVKQWLCERCINDLHPNHSTLYSCSICLANESNYELSIMGSPAATPDFLKPIHENGKWCHLLCALFQSDLIHFKNTPFSSLGTKKATKEEGDSLLSAVESISNNLAIENVSRVYLHNFDKKCAICNLYNGAIVPCDLCEAEKVGGTAGYHVTCAQDVPDFKLGFKLISQRPNERDNRYVRIGEAFGRLKPVLLCPKHCKAPSYYSLRAEGNRSYGAFKDETKPLIEMFIEDISRGTSNHTKISGPQFKANSYMQLVKDFERKHIVRGNDNYIRVVDFAHSMSIRKFPHDKTCSRCASKVSPMWWFAESQANADDTRLLCQVCYHADDLSLSEEMNAVGSDFLSTLNKPLSANGYGITDPNDSILDVYKPMDRELTVKDVNGVPMAKSNFIMVED